MEQLKEKGVGTQVHYIPVHLQPYYRKNFGYKKGDFPIAEKCCEGIISLPMYPELTEEEIRYVAEQLSEII